MPGLLTGLYSYYYIILILQGICVIHSLRKGTQAKWIWLIVFLPVIGSIAYIFTEIIKKRHVSTIQSGVAGIVNPTGRISDLEKRFKFSDTFSNRVALADAYLEHKQFEKAIELYEPALKGLHEDNEHVIKNLIIAYHETGGMENIVRIAPRIQKSIDFSKSRSNLLYAFALELTGRADEAEKEYKKMNHRFSNFEARYYYGDFLLRQNKTNEATDVFHDILDEAQHMNRKEKGNSKQWIDKAEQEWNNLAAQN